MFDQLSLLSTIHSAPLWFKAVLGLIFLGMTAIVVAGVVTLLQKSTTLASAARFFDERLNEFLSLLSVAFRF